MVFAGLATRTAIGRTTIGVVGAAEALEALAGFDAHRYALAGVPTRLNMAGGERYVQRETLKSFGLSRGRLLTPGFQSATDVAAVNRRQRRP